MSKLIIGIVIGLFLGGFLVYAQTPHRIYGFYATQTPEFQKKTPAPVASCVSPKDPKHPEIPACKVEPMDTIGPYITHEPMAMPGGIAPDGKVYFLKLDKNGNVLANCVNK